MKLVSFLFVILFSQLIMASDGMKLFKACTQCHTIGGGDKIGPDLAGVSKRRTVQWITKFVNYPDGMIEGDDEEDYKGSKYVADKQANHIFAAYKPQSMTEQELTEAQVKVILAYIDGLKKEPKGKIATEFDTKGLLKKTSKFYKKLPKQFQ